MPVSIATYKMDRKITMKILIRIAVAVNILVVILVRCCTSTELPLPVTVEVKDRSATLYVAYLKRFGKQYDSEELTRRFGIFKRSLKEIVRMNRESGANFGWTKFSDVASEELMSSTHTLLSSCGSNVPITCGNGPHNKTLNYHRGEPIPDKFDWRAKGVVGPVLDQKLCNGCWAFGIVGAMETQAAISRGVFGPRRSIQELIDCSRDNNGCGGGNVVTALNFLCKNEWGVVTEEAFPLKLVTQTCKRTFWHDGLQLRQFWSLCNVDEADIMRLVYHHGPVIVVVNADPWMGYINGVIQRACVRNENDPKHVDHVVQIVGYDNSSDTKVPYFIVRNSHGADFGEEGYVRLAIGGNVCGLADKVAILDVYA